MTFSKLKKLAMKKVYNVEKISEYGDTRIEVWKEKIFDGDPKIMTRHIENGELESSVYDEIANKLKLQ